MKDLIILSIAWLIPCNAFNQVDANWVFGKNSGLLFNDGEIISYTTSIYSIESSASISDSMGNLIFYSDGITVWNKEHDEMENGDSLFNNILSYFENTSSTQGALILPKPSSTYEFYLFSLAPFNYSPGLSYSIIDLTYNGGLGKVISKENVLLSDNLTEKLIAIKHGNGQDWWIMGHETNTNLFYKYLLTKNGIFGPYYQEIGSLYNYDTWGNIFGEMKASSDGNTIISCSLNILDLFQFDRCSGELSNWKQVNPPDSVGAVVTYSCEFSENLKYAYLIFRDKWLYQLNIDSNDSNYLQWQLLYFYSDAGYSLGQLEIAVDHKIYFTSFYENTSSIDVKSFKFLNVINYPDLDGLSSDIDTLSVNLGENKSFAGLPNMPNYNLGALAGSECDTLTEINTSTATNSGINIYPNPTRDFIQIQLNNPDAYFYTIKNLMCEITQAGILPNNKKIDLQNMQSGMYFIEIRNAENINVGTEKIIKQ